MKKVIGINRDYTGPVEMAHEIPWDQAETAITIVKMKNGDYKLWMTSGMDWEQYSYKVHAIQARLLREMGFA